MVKRVWKGKPTITGQNITGHWKYPMVRGELLQTCVGIYKDKAFGILEQLIDTHIYKYFKNKRKDKKKTKTTSTSTIMITIQTTKTKNWVWAEFLYW